VCAEISSSGTEKGALPPRRVMGIGFFLEQGEELKGKRVKLGDERFKTPLYNLIFDYRDNQVIF
jgi:hypothetical protein